MQQSLYVVSIVKYIVDQSHRSINIKHSQLLMLCCAVLLLTTKPHLVSKLHTVLQVAYMLKEHFENESCPCAALGNITSLAEII